MRVLQCGYAESKRNVLRRILNVLCNGWSIKLGLHDYESVFIARSVVSDDGLCRRW